MEDVKLLLEQGLDVEAETYITFPEGNPPPSSPIYQWFDLTYTLRPLHLAAWGGEPAVAELLLDAGAEIDAKGGEWNALYFALAHDPNPAMVALLLDRGSSLNPTGSASETALHQAARFNTNPAVVELLLDRDIAPVNAKSNYGGTPLHQAAWHNPNHAVVELLLDRGADVNSAHLSGYTPLHVAAYNPNPLVASALLDGGARIEGLDNGVPQTPLSLAAYNFEPRVAEVLLDKGADVDARDGLPLRNAVLHRNLAVATLLLNRGANLEARPDQYSRTPLHVAVLNILTPEPEVEDETDKELGMLELLLERGADTEAEFSGSTPLMTLISKSDKGHYPEVSISAVKLLLERGADVSRGDTGASSPMHRAALVHSVEVMQLLLDAGADVNATDARGETPLHIVVHYVGSYPNHPATIGWLLDAGADISVQNTDGLTPCDLALNRQERGSLPDPSIVGLLCP